MTFPNTHITNMQCLCGRRVYVMLCYCKRVPILPEHINYAILHQENLSSINTYLKQWTQKINVDLESIP